MGILPLSAVILYLWDFLFGFAGDPFVATSLLTALAFVVIGWLKAYVTKSTHWKAILETLILGVIAAVAAYFVGDVLERIIVG